MLLKMEATITNSGPRATHPKFGSVNDHYSEYFKLLLFTY